MKSVVWICLALLLPAIEAVTYTVSKSANNPYLGGTYNLRCAVDGIDPNAKDSIIVWYQERDVYQALLGRVEGRERIGRVVAYCRTVDGVSTFKVNSNTVLPFPDYIRERNCQVDDFRIGIRWAGMQHIGEWWCYYTSMEPSAKQTIKITGDLVEPADKDGLMDIRGGRDARLDFYLDPPDQAMPSGKAAGLPGNRTTAQCPIDTSAMTAPIKYAWNKVGGPNLSRKTKKREIFNNGSFTYFNIEMNDAGMYECHVTSDGQTTTAEVEIIVYQLPPLTLFIETSQFIGAVSPVKNDNLLTLVWYSQKPGSTESEVVDSKTLAFVGGENERNFRYPLDFSRAYHGGNLYVEFYAYLPGVAPFPYVTRSQDYLIQVPFPVSGVSLLPSERLGHIRAVEGQTTQVTCTAEGGGDPPEMLHFWQIANGTRGDLGANGIGVQWIVQEKPKKIIQSRMLETFTRYDNGSSLECTAQGENGTQHASSQLLEVFWLPDVFNFTMSPDKDVIPADSDVIFSCSSSGGYPDDVTVSLEYGGKTLELVDGVLTVSEVTDENAGRYSCTLTGRAGTVTKYVFLAVQREPLSLRDSIGPLILVIVVTFAIVSLIAAFFLYFMCRGDPDKRKRKKKPKPVREPRFRPPKPDKSQKKQKTPPPKPFSEFTDITPDIPDENGRLNHVAPPEAVVVPPPKPVENEVMADVNEVVLEIPPSPRVPKAVEVDMNGTIDSAKFKDGKEFKYVDEDSEDEVTRL